MIYYAPTDHIGHYGFPDDCTSAWVYDCPGLTSVTFPETCTHAGVWNCPGLTSVNGVRVNSAAEAEPYLREIAKHALQSGRLDMKVVRHEDTECGTVACIAGWAGVLFPELVRPGRELVDAIAVLGLEAASMFFKSTPEGRAFLERFVEGKP